MLCNVKCTACKIWTAFCGGILCKSVKLTEPPDAEPHVRWCERSAAKAASYSIKEDLCLVAVPSYGGRIPSVVTDMFRNVKADGTKAILAAVFGNRAIDDTLLELQDVLEASGFVCIAGMEAVAEHSLMHQFGTGRPDQQDEKELLEFAAKILQNSETQRTPAFPGNRPYREYGGVPLKPVANGKCTSCGLYAKECPAGAIPLDNPKMTDKDKCISCMHCVAVCPKKARNYSKLVSFIAGLKMKKVCSGRKENKLYL